MTYTYKTNPLDMGKIWCGYCKAYVFLDGFKEHMAEHARRLEKSSGPELEEE